DELVDAILELNKETRFILLTPIRHEKLPPPLPDPARHNEMLASYAKAIGEIADKRGLAFADLSVLLDTGGNLRDAKLVPPATTPIQLTDDGIHLNGLGYLAASTKILDDLGCLKDWKYPDFARREELREAIIGKNQLFFNRWRPE